MTGKPLKEKMRQARKLALDLLCQMDVAKLEWDEAVEAAEEHARVSPESLDIALELAKGALDNHRIIDDVVTRLSPEWPTERQPGVDRNIIRLAIFEMHSGRTPVPVVIDEAIELAKLYGSEDSGKFVNGVLEKAREDEAFASNS